MRSLTTTFQNRLEISRGKAVGRVIGFCLLIALAVAIVATVFTFFPYSGTRTHVIPILPGNHIQVSKILDGEVQVEREQFLQLTKDNQTFIAIEDGVFNYMAKVGGVSYRYEQIVGYDYRYHLSGQTIKEGTVVRELHRDTTWMIIGFIVLPFLVLLLLCFPITRLQARKIGYNNYRNVFNNSFTNW